MVPITQSYHILNVEILSLVSYNKKLIEFVYMNSNRYGDDGKHGGMNIIEFWIGHYDMKRLDRFKLAPLPPPA